MKVLVHISIQATSVIEVDIDTPDAEQAVTRSCGEPRLLMGAFVVAPPDTSQFSDDTLRVQVTNFAYAALANWVVTKATKEGAEVLDVQSPQKSADIN